MRPLTILPLTILPLTILPLTILVATFAFAPLLSPRPAAAERTVEGNRITEGIPQLPKRITDRMRQYQNTRSASVRGWTSDAVSYTHLRAHET